MLDRFSTDREQSWRALLADPGGCRATLVAVGEANRVDGFCALAAPSRDDDADERTAEIAATYVEPSRWHTGIGTALLDGALARLRRDGYEQATLWVFAANQRAHPLWVRFGFEPDGREDRHHWSGGLLEVRLRAPL